MTDNEAYVLTIVTGFIIGLVTFPFVRNEIPKGEFYTFLGLYVFMWTIAGPIILVWALGAGIIYYINITIETYGSRD